MKLNKFNKKLREEYNATFDNEEISIKPKVSIHKKLAPLYIFASLVLVFGLFLVGQHIGTDIYNTRQYEVIEEYNNKLIDLRDNGIIKIESEKEYNNVFEKKVYEEKDSILSSIINSFKNTKSDIVFSPSIGLGGIPGASMAVSGVTQPNSSESNTSTGTVIDTNNQVEGIDEADISKCDGKYIYYYSSPRLIIYDLMGNKLIDEQINLSTNDEYKDKYLLNYYRKANLYIKDDKIIVLGNAIIQIYSFDGNELKLEYKNNLAISDSRLVDNYIYLVTHQNVDKEEFDYENLYYDGYSKIQYIYSITRINLETMEIQEVQNLNSGTAKLYMNNEYIVLATSVYANYNGCGQLTLSTIFDSELNPIGVVKTRGTVLNQFSMDIKNGYFRIVNTDTYAESDTKYNTISIFDLNNLELVGFLNEGIGKARQTVRSVRYEGDKCFIVTYETQDPLYELDLSDPTNPTIVDVYESPGYSTYLHTFVINDDKYLLGLGYTDEGSYKISIYQDGEENTQIGDDFIISRWVYNEVDYITDYSIALFDNHKKLFIYSDNENLYLGFNMSTDNYVMLKIDVDSEDNVISVYKEIEVGNETRCFLINGMMYIPTLGELIVESLY